MKNLFKLCFLSLLFVCSLASATTQPKSLADVVTVFNASDPKYFIYFFPIAQYNSVKYQNIQLSSHNPIGPGQSTFFNFEGNALVGDLATDITVAVRESFTGVLYACTQKIPHDNTGPQGNWDVAVNLEPSGPGVYTISCEMRKKTASITS